MVDRKLMQEVFIRICQDSKFSLDAIRAAQLSAAALRCEPLEIMYAMPSLSVMEEIAAGQHPASRRAHQ